MNYSESYILYFFSPEDLNIIKEGPAGRRRFIDLELSQLDKIYLSNLTNYNRIINQRNALLKDIYNHQNLAETLDIWDMQLAEYGTRVLERRQQFIEQVKRDYFRYSLSPDRWKGTNLSVI